MISTESFEASWIDSKSKELQYNDKNIIEKVIRAFSLLEMLAKSGCPFHFKGGSCLMLLLKNGRHRLSIDIDIFSWCLFLGMLGWAKVWKRGWYR